MSPRLNISEPPVTDNPLLNQWLLEVHNILSGIGHDGSATLDDQNISSISPSKAGAIANQAGAVIPTNIGFDSDDVSEGTTNLYLTSERIDDRVNALIIDGNALTKTYDDAGNTLTLDVDKVAISTDASASSVNVASSNISSAPVVYNQTWGQEVETLGNELKGDVNTLVTDINAVKDSLNDLKAKMRTTGLLAI